MMRIFFYGLVLIFISGCSFQTVVSASNEYKIDVGNKIGRYDSTGCKGYVLRVKNVESYTHIKSRSIYYGVGDYELSTYTKSNWQEAPFKSIKHSIIKELRESKIFKDIVSNRSSVQPDYVLEYSVENFIQRFSEDMKSSTVEVKIHFSLINYKTSKLLYSTTIEKKLPSASLDAIGGVKAISRALGDVIEQDTLWLNDRCKEDIK
ncbi:ABC-type transport auxiliary lipoprotein family protein [Sulfurimonas sp. HSL-1716]|uniref:ABC-type transport auxiliary lipoprotein family protein n=1 Tax=Hydrocurvibacter sulfurireducens TaxID=3131937 RepID=UPI0031F925C5